MQTENFSIIGASGTWTRNGMVRVIRYEEGAATGGVSPKIRVRASSGNAFDVEMKPGKTITLSEPVKGLLLTNISGGADVTGKLTYGDGTVSDDAIVGAVDLNTNTIAALIDGKYNVRPEPYSGSINSNAVLAANTAETFFTAAANTGGALVQFFNCVHSNAAGNIVGSLLAKATAPGNALDGVPVAGMHQAASAQSGGSTSTIYYHAELDQAVFIPAGLGLHWCQSGATGAQDVRQCRWVLL